MPAKINNQRTPNKKQANKHITPGKPTNNVSIPLPKPLGLPPAAKSPKKPSNVRQGNAVNRSYLGFLKFLAFRAFFAYVGFTLLFTCNHNGNHVVCRARNEINDIVIKPSLKYLQNTEIGSKTTEFYQENINPFYTESVKPLAITSTEFYQHKVKPVVAELLSPVALKINHLSKQFSNFIAAKYAQSTIIKPSVDSATEYLYSANQEYILPTITSVQLAYKKAITETLAPLVSKFYIQYLKPVLNTYLIPFWQGKLKPFLLVLPGKIYSFIRFYALPKFQYGATVALDSLDYGTTHYVIPYSQKLLHLADEFYQAKVGPQLSSINKRYVDVYRVKYPILNEAINIFSVVGNFVNATFKFIASNLLNLYYYSYEIITSKDHPVLALRRERTIELSFKNQNIKKQNDQPGKATAHDNTDFLGRVKHAVSSSFDEDSWIKESLDKGTKAASNGFSFISKFIAGRAKNISGAFQGKSSSNTGSEKGKGGFDLPNANRVNPQLTGSTSHATKTPASVKPTISSPKAPSPSMISTTTSLTLETIQSSPGTTESGKDTLLAQQASINRDKADTRLELEVDNKTNEGPANPVEDIKKHADILKQQISMLKKKINEELLQEINQIIAEANELNDDGHSSSEIREPAQPSASESAHPVYTVVETSTLSTLEPKENRDDEASVDSAHVLISEIIGSDHGKNYKLDSVKPNHNKGSEPRKTTILTATEDAKRSDDQVLDTKFTLEVDTVSDSENLVKVLSSVTSDESTAKKQLITTENQNDLRPELTGDVPKILEPSPIKNVIIPEAPSALVKKLPHKSKISEKKPKANFDKTTAENGIAAEKPASDSGVKQENPTISKGDAIDPQTSGNAEQDRSISIDKTLNADIVSETSISGPSVELLEQLSSHDNASSTTKEQSDLPEIEAPSTTESENILNEFVKVAQDDLNESNKKSFEGSKQEPTRHDARKAASDWVKGAKKSIAEEIAKIRSREVTVKTTSPDKQSDYQAPVQDQVDSLLDSKRPPPLASTPGLKNEDISQNENSSAKSDNSSDPVDENADDNNKVYKTQVELKKKDTQSETPSEKPAETKGTPSENSPSKHTNLTRSVEDNDNESSQEPTESVTKTIRIKKIKKIKRKVKINTELKPKPSDEL